MGDVERIDYYDDPNAPTPDRDLTPAALAWTQHGGHILMQRRSDSGLWALPGGRQEPGESLMQTAVRETFEETGVQITIVGLVGIYSDPRSVRGWYRDGVLLGASQENSILFRGKVVDPEHWWKVQPSSESTAVRWVPESEIVYLPMAQSMALRVRDGLYFSPESGPVLRP